MRRPAGAGRQLVGGDQHRAEAAGGVEVLADRPLRRALLVVAHRDVVEAAVAEDEVQGGVLRDVLAAPADHHRELGLVVELVRDARAQRLAAVRQQRTRAAEEEPRVLGLLATAFLGMVVVVQAEADHLAGLGQQRRQRRGRQRQARRRRSQGRARRGGEVDAGAQRRAQVGRHLRLSVLEIDEGVAVDRGQPGGAVAQVGGELHAAVSFRNEWLRCACFSRALGGREMPQWSTRPAGHFQSSGLPTG